jgi:hypothetical protein
VGDSVIIVVEGEGQERASENSSSYMRKQARVLSHRRIALRTHQKANIID